LRFEKILTCFQVLLFLVTSPMYILVTVAQQQPQLTLADIIFFTIMLSLLTIETVADEQQWRMSLKVGISEQTNST